VQPLIDAGLTREEALVFDEKYKGWAVNNQYNSTVIDFAFFLKRYPLTTGALFQTTNSLHLTVSSLRNIEPVISTSEAYDQKGRYFVLKYPFLILDDEINVTDAILMSLDFDMPSLTSHVIKNVGAQTERITTLSLLHLNILNKTLTEDQALEFLEKHPDLLPLNQSDLPYVKFYPVYPVLTDSIIKTVPHDLGVPILLNLNPFLKNKTFTENDAAYFINIYPDLTKSYGLNKNFPEVIYIFTQIPKTTDVGIKTTEDFEFLVETINSIYRYADESKKSEEKIAFFMERYPELIKTYDWDDENKRIFEFHELYPTLTDTLLRLGIKRDYVLLTIDNVKPYLKQIPESSVNDFVKRHAERYILDGLNATEARFLPYRYEYKELTDTVIEKLETLDAILFVLDNYYSYIKDGTITTASLESYIVKDPGLFKVKECVHPLADPDEDFINNISEIRAGTDIFLGIGNFSWSPIKVINSKVEEGNIYVRAKSLRGILPSKLQWIPINYTQFPLEVQLRAFPNETVKEFLLIPFDENLIESLITIKNITGGREYLVSFTVRDKAGVLTLSLKTPYIREYGNIAPLDDVLIGAYYYPWYSPYRHWKEGYKGTPLIGEYDSRDSVIISKHIDWATGHGIDFFLLSWWGPNSFEDVTIKDYFLKNSLINDIKIGILYESSGRLTITKEDEMSIDLDNPVNREVLLSDFNYIATNYFGNPHYLKINGASVVELHLARIFKGNVSEVISHLREKAPKMYLIGDLVYWQDPSTSFERERIKLYDAITSYNMHTSVQEILDDFENNVAKKYGEWFSAARNLGVGFVPSALPGFDDRAVRTGNIPLSKSIDRFKKQMEIAKSYVDDSLKIVMITTFNEWHEYTYVEPSIEDGHKYLQIIKEYLR